MEHNTAELDVKTQAFVDWALNEILTLRAERDALRIDIRRASVPCGCEANSTNEVFVSKKNNKDRWNVYRIYKGIDSIVDVDGTFRDKNDKEIEVKN